MIAAALSGVALLALIFGPIAWQNRDEISVAWRDVWDGAHRTDLPSGPVPSNVTRLPHLRVFDYELEVDA